MQHNTNAIPMLRMHKYIVVLFYAAKTILSYTTKVPLNVLPHYLPHPLL